MRRPPGAVPTEIVDATVLALHEHGLEELTFLDIARHGNLAVDRVSACAETPVELAGLAMEQSYESLRDTGSAWLPIPDGGSLADGLNGILRETFRGLKDPGFLRLAHLLMLQPHTSDEEGPDSVQTSVPSPRAQVLGLRARTEDEFTAWFRQAISRDPSIGPQPRGTDRTCARLVILCIDGFVSNHRIDGRTDPDAYRSTLVDILVASLRA